MRILFLSDTWTILLCFLVWLCLQTGFAFFCLFLPNRYFAPDGLIFRSHCWEKEGQIYEKLFNVKRWKHLLPDGGMVWKKRGFRKKKLESFSKDSLNRFLIESSRGEMTHWLPIFFFWIFWLFTPPMVPWIMLIYALLANMPCIIVQRYNRPRVQRVLNNLKGREKL